MGRIEVPGLRAQGLQPAPPSADHLPPQPLPRAVVEKTPGQVAGMKNMPALLAFILGFSIFSVAAIDTFSCRRNSIGWMIFGAGWLGIAIHLWIRYSKSMK